MITTSTTGNHATGDYVHHNLEPGELPPIKVANVWIDDPTQAKQGMARDHDVHDTTAAPDHPHTGPEQSGRQ